MSKEIQLPDGGTIVLPDDVETRDLSAQNLEALMDGLTEHGSHTITIEFECGDCCKKVLNGKKLFFVGSLAVLLPAPGETLLLKAFSGGCVVDKERMKAIVIGASRICAIEIRAVQVDP